MAKAYSWGLLFAALAVFPPAAFAADGATILAGHIAPQIRTATKLDRVPADENVELSLVLRLDQPLMDRSLAQVHKTKAGGRKRFLTSSDFASTFGLAAKRRQIKRFAEGAGLTVKADDDRLGSMIVKVFGPAVKVEKAFGVELNHYRAADGQVFRGLETEPSIPASLAPDLLAVLGLSNVMGVAVPHFRARPAGIGAAAAANPSSLTGESAFGATALSPADIASVYGLSGGLVGTGQTIALMELDGYNPSDIANYENNLFPGGAPSATVTFEAVDGAAANMCGSSLNQSCSCTTLDACNPGGGILDTGMFEVAMDIELVIALSSGSTVLVYTNSNSLAHIVDAYDKIMTDHLAQVVSTSWGFAQQAGDAATMTSEAAIFQAMALQGQTVFAAAGDHGAYDNGSSGGTVVTDDPASQPYVTGVGGTTLSGAVGGSIAETYWNNNANCNSYSNCSGGAGGGGIANHVAGYWALPSYQTGIPGTFSQTFRNVPDVALNADDVNSPYAVYVGSTTAGGPTGWYGGGTSAAAPLWAALTAIINQKRAANALGPLGFANPDIYQLGVDSSYGSEFRDVTSGANAVYSAGTGYDNLTGWGAFKANALIGALGGAAPSSLPAGCASGFNVAQDGSQNFTTITAALDALPLTLTDDACVVIRDTQTYTESVTVRNFVFASGANTLTILSDPSFVSSAPAVNPPPASTAAFVIANASVSVVGINVISTNSITYGVQISSPYVSISSVNVLDAGGKISLAGVLASSWTTVSFTSVTVGGAKTSGYSLPGSKLTTVTRSSAAATGASGYGLLLTGASSCTISGDSLSGSTAVYVLGSTGTVIGASALAATNSSGAALQVGGGSNNLTVSSSSLSALASGTGISLQINNNGALVFTSNTLTGAQYGMQIATQSAGASLSITSMTFAELASGATAINFTGGTFVATFTTVSFDASVGADVNSSALSSASNITMASASGAHSGPAYADDAGHETHWTSGRFSYPGCVTGFNVAQNGSGDYTTISAAVSALPTSLGGNACVVIDDAGTYAEQVTVQGIATNGYSLTIEGQNPASPPTIVPPASSTAAFQVMATSVTLSNLKIQFGVVTMYGVLLSSDYASLNGVALTDPNGYIVKHGVLMQGSWDSIVGSTVSISAYVPVAELGTPVGESTATIPAAVYLEGAISNTISHTYINEAFGFGVYFNDTYGSQVVGSTVVGGLSQAYACQMSGVCSVDPYDSLWIDEASVSNLVTGSVLNGFGVDLFGADNTLDASVVTLAYSANLYYNCAPSFAQTAPPCLGSYYFLTNGSQFYYGLSVDPGSDGITISRTFSDHGADFSTDQNTTLVNSTVTIVAPGYPAVFLQKSSNDGIVSSYALGSIDVELQGSTATTIASSTLDDPFATGEPIWFASGSSSLTLISDALVGGQYGILLDTGGAVPNVVASGLNFSALTPGATAIDFSGGVYVATFSAAFFDASVSAVISAAALNPGSTVTMLTPTGPRVGPSYENDPSGRVYWNWPSILIASSAPAVGSLGINRVFTTTATLTDGISSAPVVGATLSFFFGASTAAATTNSLGQATATFNTGLLFGSTVYNVAFAGSAAYAAASGSATVNSAAGARPAGCATGFNVAQNGSQDFTTITAALNASTKTLTGNACIVIRDTQTYTEQVSVQNFVPGNFTLTIMADPSFVSSAPSVSPPASGSTAAFVIANASVSVIGINVVPTSPLAYGVLVSSAYVRLSSVNVQDAGGNIIQAGVSLGSWGTFSNSTVAVVGANGVYLNGAADTVVSGNSISNSTTSFNENPISALSLNYSNFNTISNNSVYNSIGSAVYVGTSTYNNFTGGIFSNGESVYYPAAGDVFFLSSVLIDVGGNFNAFVGCSIQGLGTQVEGDNNTFTRSTFTLTNLGAGPAVPGNYNGYLYQIVGNEFSSAFQSVFLYGLLANGNSNAVSQSVLNYGAWFIQGGQNSISQSTISIGAPGYPALLLIDENDDAVSNSYLQSSVAVEVQGSTETTIAGSSLVDPFATGSPLWFTAGSSSLTLTTDVLRGGQNGLLLDAPSAGPSVGAAGLTFAALSPGATAIDFTGGVFIATFSAVSFDASVSTNVSAATLGAGSRVTMLAASGPRAGPAYESDPSGDVQWNWPALLTVSSVPAAAPNQVFTATAALTDGVSGSSLAGQSILFSFEGATATATTNVLGQATAAFNAGLLVGTTVYTAAFSGNAAYLAASSAAAVTGTLLALPPTTSILSPTPGGAYSSLSAFSGSSSDTVVVSTVVLSLRDASAAAPNCYSPAAEDFTAPCPAWFSAQGSTNAWTYSFGAPPWTDGHSYVLYSSATNVFNIAQLALSSAAFTFATSTPTVYYAGSDVSPAGAVQGSKTALLSFTLASPQPGISLTGVTLDETGLAPDADVTNVLIYLGSGASAFDPVNDPLLGAGTMRAGVSTVTLAVPTLLVPGQPQVFFAVYSVAQTAGVGDTVGASIIGPQSVALSSSVVPTGLFPTNSKLIPVTAQSEPGGVTSVSSYPNPMDTRLGPVRIAFTLPQPSDVSIRILTLYGAQVRQLHASGNAGRNTVSWDGSDATGRKVGMGVYIVVIDAAGSRATYKIAVLH
jgi:kumamolisin